MFFLQNTPTLSFAVFLTTDFEEIKLNQKLTSQAQNAYRLCTSSVPVENLLDIEINYYVKVNFTSLIDIVNAIEGVIRERII